MLNLVLLGMYFDAVVVFVTSQTLLFRLPLAVLCMGVPFQSLFCTIVPPTTVNYFLNQIKIQTHSITVMPELGGQGGQGGHWPPLPIFGRSVNPILTGGGQIIPIYYYWPLQIFSPSGITASKALASQHLHVPSPQISKPPAASDY